MAAPDLYKTFDAEEPTTTLEPGMSLAGRYKLIKKIGRGGMGVVWSAEEKAAGRKVVLKFVPTELKNFESAVAQLKESFQKIHGLQHQHICPVHTLEEDVSFGYYHVMKWLEGETLDEYIVRIAGRQQPLPFDEVLRILRPVAEALDYAHGQRIIHRDIKPSNIFIVLNDEKTVRDVQVIDFGLASEIRSSLSRVSQIQFDNSGTRPYMAPEQWRGRLQSAATDQYSLAVTAYEMLAGYLPFEGDDAELLRMAIIQDPPEPIRGMSEQVNAALLKALAKDGSGRFENCVQFVAALGGAEISGVKKESSVPSPKQLSGSSRTGTTSIVPGVAPLMTRGHLSLEDSDWKKSIEFFDSVLNLDAKYAPAYIGLLCAELKVQTEEQLGDYEKPISEQGNFKKAVRFAEEEYKAKLEGYDAKIRERLRQEEERLAEQKRREQERLRQERERIAEQQRQEQYDRLIQAKGKAPTEVEYQELAKEFRSMNGYKDTAKLVTVCDQAALELRYRRVCEETKQASTEADWQQLATAFRAMDGYRNTVDLTGQCDAQYRRLKDHREQREKEERRIERERRAGTRNVLTILGVEYAFRWCPAGTFTMGSPVSEVDWLASVTEECLEDDETQPTVTLSKGFWMLETQVTQEMWESVMGSNPSHFKGDKRLPVESVSWENCQEFIRKLNEVFKRAGDVSPRFSLPTEAQWEYACRANTTGPYGAPDLDSMGWYYCNAGSKTHVVGTKQANVWGLYDMHGNVWEWCSDWDGDYPSGAVTDPVGPSFGTDRVIRGGGWDSRASNCRSANRDRDEPSNRFRYLGLRLSFVSESE